MSHIINNNQAQTISMIINDCNLLEYIRIYYKPKHAVAIYNLPLIIY